MRSAPCNGYLRLHGGDLSRLQRVLDPAIAAGLFQLFAQHPGSLAEPLLLPSWIWVLLLTAIILPAGGVYGSARQSSLTSVAWRISTRWMLVLMALLLLSFATKSTAEFPRLNTSLWALSSWVMLLLSHVGLRMLLRWHRQRGGNSRTILYWGNPEAALAFQSYLQNRRWMGLRMVAWFCPHPSRPDSQPRDLPRCGGGLAEMRRWLESHRVDRIVFSHVPNNEVGMEELLEFFGDTCLPVIYAPHWAHATMHFESERIGEIPCIDLWGSQRSLIDSQLKRSLDLVVASAALVLLSPLMLAIAAAVSLSGPGPVLYRQDRYGLDGRRFQILKFRTMHVLEAGDQPGLRQATRQDPRVTAVGRVLRRWSLDELPQLLNVVRGEMSLVGPRPHAVEHNEYYRRLIPGYMQRHAFKPGLTGLAQVEGLRGETSTLQAMAGRVEADMRYQRHWTLGLDLRILLRTFFQLRSGSAY